jgi:hypothetical protein
LVALILGSHFFEKCNFALKKSKFQRSGILFTAASKIPNQIIPNQMLYATKPHFVKKTSYSRFTDNTHCLAQTTNLPLPYIDLQGK